MSISDYYIAERRLHPHFNNIKRWVEKNQVVGLEVYSSPILMAENVMKIKKLLSGMRFSINGNTNQSYILIKYYDN